MATQLLLGLAMTAGLLDKNAENVPVRVFRGSELTAIAAADYAKVPETDHGQVYYLVADLDTARLLSFVMSSCSLQPEIELCQPGQVAEGLWRIDIGNLVWDLADWRQVLEHHPYGGYHTIIRGDWLVRELLDGELAASRAADGISAAHRLLYGSDNVPKSEGEFFKFWGVDDTPEFFTGVVEGLSQINRRGRRKIERRLALRLNYFYLTRDSKKLDDDFDPLERPMDHKFDGSEYIAGFQKFSSRVADGETENTGTVQYYLLADAQGNRVYSADVGLVEDYTRFRDITSVRDIGGCMKCHTKGLQPIEKNAIVELVNKYGAAIFDADDRDFRRYHFSSQDVNIQRAQEDYARGLALHTGWTGEQLQEAIESIVRGYEADLTLKQASLELGVSPERLRDAVTRYSDGGSDVPAGVAVLVAGGPMSRDLFEQYFELLSSLLKE